jgi:hypothetical protein
MENEAIANEILAALEALLQSAGPEWTLQFLQAGLEEAAGGEMQAGAPMQAPTPAQNGQMMPQGRTVGRPRM